MGFTLGALDKSVFTKDAYKAAIEGNGQGTGYSVITIKPGARLGTENNDPPITGVIEDMPAISLQASWEQMGLPFGQVPAVQLVEKAMNFVSTTAKYAGGAPLGAAYKSRKIYSGGSYLNIDTKIKIVDWSGSSDPILASALLSYYVLPSDILRTGEKAKGLGTKLIQGGVELAGDAKEKIESTFREKIAELQQKKDDKGNLIPAAKTAEATEGIVKKSLKFASDTSDTLHTFSDLETVKSTGEQLSRNLIEGADDLFTLRSAPTPVEVRIGQFFYHTDMVIESITCNFSKQMTKYGPLWVDIDLKLSSRRHIVSLEDLGLKLPYSEKRVTFKSAEAAIAPRGPTFNQGF